MKLLQARFIKEAKECVTMTDAEKEQNKIMGDDDKLVELFKVEDEIALTHNIETEHFLLLKE